MALWTPANLAKPPVLTLDARQAVWAGSDLVSVPGFDLVTGPPTKGTAQNGIDPIRFDANGEFIEDQTTELRTGSALFYFWVGKMIVTTSDQGLFNRNWNAPTGGFVGYIRTVGLGTLTVGNLNDGPRFQTSVNAINDTNWHSQAALLGVVNGLWIDGTAVTITTSITCAQEPLSPGKIEVGRGNTNSLSETANSDFGILLILDYEPTNVEHRLIEGWGHHAYGIQASLPPGHPYLTTAPDSESFVTARNLRTLSMKRSGRLRRRAA